MKKYLYLFVTLLAITMLLPSEAAFATAKSSTAKKSHVGSVPAVGRINAFRIDKIIGSGVINLEGERMGTIDDLVIDIDTGRIAYAALEFDGFMGFDDKLFAVPWQSLTAVPAEGIFVIDQSKAKLRKAPGFDKNKWPDVGDRSWGLGIYEFYRHHLPTSRVSSPQVIPQKQEGSRSRRTRTYPGYYGVPYPYSSVWEKASEELFDPKKIETITGEILKVEFSETVRLIIYTDAKKPVLVPVGPTGYFESQEELLKPGNKVTVTGSRIIVDDTPFLIATKIKEGDKELQIRDNEGHPIWIGWKNIK